MDHGLETHVDLAASNDLSDIRRVVGLKQSNLEALFIEETLGLSQIQGGVVRRSVPLVHLATVLTFRRYHLQLHVIALPVGEESNLVSGHLDDYDSRRDTIANGLVDESAQQNQDLPSTPPERG